MPTFQFGSDDIHNMEARIAELTAEVEQMASWIVRHGQKVTDHACAECLPNGEILIHGFRCGWHTAIARNALKESGLIVEPLYATPTIPTIAHPRPTVPEGYRLVPVERIDPRVPDGWVFITADFSTRASGRSKQGSVLIKRDCVGTTWWHSLSEEQKEATDIYIYGFGESIQSAIDDAASRILAAPDGEVG